MPPPREERSAGNIIAGFEKSSLEIIEDIIISTIKYVQPTKIPQMNFLLPFIFPATKPEIRFDKV